MTLPANLKGSLAGIRDFGTQVDTETSVMYLKIDKDMRIFIYGTDAIEPEKDSLWAVDPTRIRFGYGAFNAGGRCEQEELHVIGSPMPAQDDLPEVKGCLWRSVYELPMRCASGDQIGTEVVFTASAKTAVPAAKKLLDLILDRVEDDQEAIVPLVFLVAVPWTHKTYGEQAKPEFPVDSWTTFDAMVSATTPDSEPEPEKAKPKTRVKKAEKVDEADDADVVETVPAPRTRRRRPAATA